MTVDTTNSSISAAYSGPGDYPFDFQVTDESDLKVYYIDTALTVLELTPITDYTVTVDPDGTGTVSVIYDTETTYVGTIKIERELPFTQPTDWQNTGGLDLELLERDFDRTIMLIQQLKTSVGQSINAYAWRGEWVTGTEYLAFDLIQHPTTKSLYTSTEDHTAAAAIATDISAGRLELVYDVSDVEGWKTAAAASAAAASASETAAGDSETAAALSEANASDSEAAAALSESNAATSEAAAAISESNASTSETNAGNSATNAETSATEAADARDVAQNVLLRFTYDDTTAMADPGTGAFRFDQAVINTATQIAINDVSANPGTPDLASFLNQFGGSTSTVKGYLVLQNLTTGLVYYVFQCTGTTDNSGWVQIAVTYVAGSGAFTAGDTIGIMFFRTGDKGSDGIDGEMAGPVSSTDNAVARFDGTDGTMVQDSGVIINDSNHLGVGVDPARSLHVQSTDGGIRLDRDANSVAVQMHRFPSGNWTTPWKGFVFGVNATGVNNGSFFIGDYAQLTGGAPTNRMVIDNNGNVSFEGGTVDGRDIATDGTKLDLITVTQAVDLDAIETRVNSLDAAVVLMGTWDASSGTFPGSGTAQAGESWIVSVAGTVDGVVFQQNDRIIAITDNASTTTFASNWFKADYTDDPELAAIAGLTSAANKLILFTGSGTASLLDFKDEDDMASNSATALSSQQSTKAYVDRRIKTVSIQVFAPTASVTTGDGKAYYVIPEDLNGADLILARAHVFTVSSSGLPTIQIHNVTTAVDILSTRITIDVSEKDSKDAATPAVINTSNDSVATGNELRFDVDVAGTGTLGLQVRLQFRLPA